MWAMASGSVVLPTVSEPSPTGAPFKVEIIAGHNDVGPAARKKLSGLIKFYMKKKHPFTACVKDNTKRFGAEGAKKVCATLKDIGEGDNTHWRKGGKKATATIEAEMADALITASAGNIDGLVDYLIECAVVEDHIEALQGGKPQLMDVHDVPILTTGIEYPLASGPTTFTPEDLAAAVQAQDDPSIPQPRIWIGHPDDERIHGKRIAGPPSGEPAVGKVCAMRLTDDGHTIVGDLTGVPIWLGNILGSAFPSRSIEGRFNLKTVTGKTHRLVITGLALLGVTWPGVMTLDDIASLYSETGPEVTITEATPEVPVTMAAAATRQVRGQVNVEDLRRQFYDSTRGDPDKLNWWIRTIYVDPDEIIIDADDGGSLFRMPYTVKGDKVKWGKAKKVKIQYVNASHGGIEVEPIDPDHQLIARFDKKPIVFSMALDSKALARSAPQGTEVEIKLPIGG